MYIVQRMRQKLVCEDAGKLSPEKLYDLIIDAITPSMPILLDGEEQLSPLEILDYGKPPTGIRWTKVEDIPLIDCWSSVDVDVHPGGNEGVYMCIDLTTGSRNGSVSAKTPLFIFKTLDAGPEAFAAIGALGGMIVYAMELFLMFNDIKWTGVIS